MARRFAPLAVAYAVLAACGSGRDARPRLALRIVYSIDLEKAVDDLRTRRTEVIDERRSAEARANALAQAVRVLRARLHWHGVDGARVAAEGDQIAVELPALDDEALEGVKAVVTRTGELALKVVDSDEPTMKLIAGHAGPGAPPSDPDARAQGITVHAEQWQRASTGAIFSDAYLTAADREEAVPIAEARAMGCWSRNVDAIDGQVRCFVSGRQVLDRYLRGLSGSDPTLQLRDDRQFGYQRITADGDRPRWRTYELVRRARLTSADLARAELVHGPDTGQPAIMLTFDDDGRARLADLTAETLGKKVAIVIDDVVQSAPIVQDQIGGGRVRITMGGGDPAVRERDARELTEVLRGGALPAPLRAESVTELDPARLAAMSGYVLGLEEIDRTQVALVGGKGAHLGELARMEGVRVSAGFCVTTDAFRRNTAAAPSLDERLDRLAGLKPDDRAAIAALSAELRRTVEGLAISDDVAAAITGALARLGEHAAYAVRSSATAEDSPTASFAGQHATYLNVVGPAAILEHVSRCWASLFSERAVTYRLRHGLDQRKVQMAVVVQRMVAAQAAGVLFTADPVTGHRKVTVVEACFGLGEALVSGLVNADRYQVRDGTILARPIATALEPERQQPPALTDAQVLRLDQLGRRIEAHFGRPQDVEWCLVDDELAIVQSRPITTLFPIPAAGDRDHHVYVSVGHQQMMTDAMKPLGLSLFQLTAMRPMFAAGGRLFVDVTAALASPASRAGLVEGFERADPLTGDALRTIADRADFIRSLPVAAPSAAPAGGAPTPLATDPAIVAALVARSQAALAAAERELQTRSGPAVLDFIVADLQELKRLMLDPQSRQVIVAAMEAAWWLNDQVQAWLGEKNVADTLTRSVPGNVTSAMGLALLDVADAVRPHPEVVAFLRRVDDDGFLDRLATLAGGQEARAAIAAFLDRYGMRCVGEIDITRPRWRERPSTLVPLILGNVDNFEPGAGARRFERGRQEAADKEEELLQRLRALPDGERKAGETKQMIDRVRTFAGYREYPKYAIVGRYFLYKQALLAEAERLVEADVLRDPDDIFYLTFAELHDVVRTQHVDDQLVRQREDAFRSHQALTPPRVLTSDGEVITGAYRRDAGPAGALVGLPVSAGTVEGRARVILDLAAAELEPGDILVTTYTDPSWTPLFVAIAGLVTEVGGLMTHGAVIAREYGVPAVVGVERATRLIRDGQRIRVHGTDGYVELLPAPRGQNV